MGLNVRSPKTPNSSRITGLLAFFAAAIKACAIRNIIDPRSFPKLFLTLSMFLDPSCTPIPNGEVFAIGVILPKSVSGGDEIEEGTLYQSCVPVLRVDVLERDGE